MPVHKPTAQQLKNQKDSWTNAETCNNCDQRVCICSFVKKRGLDKYFQRLYPKDVYAQQARVPHLSFEEVNLRLHGPQLILLYTTTPFFEEIAFSYANNKYYKVLYL
jgi:hypothetical protein